MAEFKYRLIKRWSPGLADWEYGLEKIKYRLIKRWSPGLADWEYGLEKIKNDVSFQILSWGNKDWAIRHAKHFNIEMPIKEEE